MPTLLSSVLRAPSPRAITSIVQTKSELDNLVRTLFDAESVGVAIADSTPAGTGEQECFTELQATRGIAFATKAGVAAYVDLEKFSGGIRHRDRISARGAFKWTG